MIEKKFLMVCLGNICRSPLAKGILSNKFSKLDVYIDSAGTSGYHIGESPDPRSINIAQKNNIDISSQRARKISKNDIKKFDLIYAMDKSNYKSIISLCESEKDKTKIKLILNESFPGKNLDVPDPYLLDDKGFKEVFDLLNAACEIVKDKLVKE